MGEGDVVSNTHFSSNIFIHITVYGSITVVGECMCRRCVCVGGVLVCLQREGTVVGECMCRRCVGE